MYNVALRILRYEQEAEDVLQEAFLDAFLHINGFRQQSSFGLWLKQIVINKSIGYLRKRRGEFITTDEIDIAEDEADEDESQYLVEQVKKAMLLLPDGYRVIISLYLFEGYDHEEISHILRISENTSRTQFLRAKRKLRSLLEKKGQK